MNTCTEIDLEQKTGNLLDIRQVKRGLTTEGPFAKPTLDWSKYDVSSLYKVVRNGDEEYSATLTSRWRFGADSLSHDHQKMMLGWNG